MIKGKRILITAGPTKELIDPVRFISNASTGKMGYAIAELLYSEGADVILVTGPSCINSNLPSERVYKIQSALEMLEVCNKHFQQIDIAIFTAAVADYRPMKMEASKIKKNDDRMTIELIKNPDIAFEFGKIKNPNQISVGFALETDNLMQYGEGKLKKKNFDFIVLNTTNATGEGFGHDTNKVSVLRKDLTHTDFELKSKKEVAQDIVAEINTAIALKSLTNH
ncbi:MAG: phosphopantothenoylcysteine decarboxylase [bacterium]|nr:phosphopantothenoylcysteine decarboxylase [bacterium]